MKDGIRSACAEVGLGPTFSQRNTCDSADTCFVAGRPLQDLPGPCAFCCVPEQSRQAPSGYIFPRAEQSKHLAASTKASSALTNEREQQTWCWHFTRRARWPQLYAKPTLKRRAGQKKRHSCRKRANIGAANLWEKIEMVKIGRHVIQSWYLARISRSEMRMVTTCPRTKSPHEPQIFYGSRTEFNGSDAAEKTTDP